MRARTFLIATFLILPIVAIGAANGLANVEAYEVEDKNLVIGRMKITVMPEYDTKEVLVIEEGKFADLTAFPSEVTFALPDKVTRLTDACSLSPGGQHFCQIYDIESGDDGKYVNLMLPYSDFFIDYKYAPFTAKENSKREFTYNINLFYDAKLLEVHVQKPWRAENFEVTLPGTNLKYEPERYEKKGFEYAKYVFKNVKAGDVMKIAVAYYKTDTMPSIDAKYASMIQQEVFARDNGELILGIGILALGLVMVFRLRKRRSPPPGAAQ